jgi:DNA-3-methyladenine glycosylase
MRSSGFVAEVSRGSDPDHGSNGVRPVPSSFYSRATLIVAAELIGKVLAHTVEGRRTAGVIVEVEAYIGEDDPACHAAPGPTKRNAPLYGPPGRAYVYLNYGLHYLVNAVTEPEGAPAAILIRALDPLEGVDLMTSRRLARRPGRHARATAPARHELARGPGNVTVAMGIDLRQNEGDLTNGPLTIEDHDLRAPRIAWSRRIGISVGVSRRWRCTWRQHPAVSK